MIGIIPRQLKWWARIGYCTRGVVYLIVGYLAVLAAIGPGGETTGAKGALERVWTTPYGDILMLLIAAGLLGYAAWRFIQSIFDADNHGHDAKGLFIRGGLFISFVVHLGLAIFAVNLLFGKTGGGSGGWVSRVLQQAWGRWLLVIIGIGVFGAALAHAFKAYKRTYRKYLVMNNELMQKAEPVIIFGLFARSAIYTLAAFFMVMAAWRYDPQQAKGTQSALDFLQSQQHGSILLAVVALGLIAFGVYSLLEGFYRRIEDR